MTTRTAPSPRPAPPTSRGPGQRAGDILSRPLTDYFMILTCVMFLTFFGLVMVAAATIARAGAQGSVWSLALKQAALVGLGLVVMWIGLKLRPGFIRRMSLPFLLIAVALLLATLVKGIGGQEVGSQSWLTFGPFRLQASEVAKIAIAVWGASYLAKKQPDEHSAAQRYLRFAFASLLVFVLIIAQKDVGMAVVFITMVVFVLLLAGIGWRWIIGLGGMVVAVVAAYTISGGFRSDRLTVYVQALSGNFSETRSTAFQSYQGYLSLAEGGVTGVGIGQSRAKWFYLPEAQNDFIFAIIGEETGLVGAGVVAVVYTLLLIFGLRCALRQNDRYKALLAGALTLGVVSQAYINMAYVVGLLPVTGLQLPLISSGGSSTVITLGAMGLLANCARHEPEAIAAMQSGGRPALDRVLLLPEPWAAPPVGRARRSRGERTAEPLAGAPRRSGDTTSSPRQKVSSLGPTPRQRRQATKNRSAADTPRRVRETTTSRAHPGGAAAGGSGHRGRGRRSS
ncbi:putative peptidoglycan glycosyltransferase FtsW [Corynebacterium mendelii]|uniref:Probable peptidoglycan glycosyltransferase FtsW n=1 Tax=Corynebacterium mendelii TaxID=2765362 RepID=A0A939IUE3_9CORY|nr:putative peptidoglycan glycosyltransferase FtsW [Corynebacterium mendelii]MBN9643101.1 cell division protein FtsW [Corynebacterium mendelii]